MKRNVAGLVLCLFFALFAAIQSANADDKIDRAVVRIVNGVDPDIYGTGFIVLRQPGVIYIVTANHVVDPPENNQGQVVKNAKCGVAFRTRPNQVVKGEIVDSEPWDKDGLALVAVKETENIPPNLETLSLAPLEPLSKGSSVSWTGHAVQNEWLTLTGEVNAFPARKIFFSGRVEGGSSGSPLLKDGKVVGMVMRDHDPSNEAIPAFSLWLYLRNVAGGILGDLSVGKVPLADEARSILSEKYKITPTSMTFIQSVTEGDIDVLRLHLIANKNYAQMRDSSVYFGEDEQDEVNALNAPLALIAALSVGQSEAAYELIRAGADTTQKNDEGKTLLHYAAENGDVKTVQILLERDGHADVQDEDGETALMKAVRGCHSTVVRVLLASGADVQKANTDGNSVMDIANEVEPEHEEDEGKLKEIVEALRAKGAGGSFLNAVRDGDSVVVKKFMAQGVDINAVGTRNHKRFTALQVAVERGHKDIVAILLRAGVKLQGYFDIPNFNGYSSEQLSNFDGRGLSSENGPSSSALLYSAIRAGRPEILQLLFAAGLPKNSKEILSPGTEGETIVTWSALVEAIDVNSPEIVKLLLSLGANVQGNAYDQIPLFLAIRRGNPIIVNALLEAGADSQIQGKMRSYDKERISVIELLLKTSMPDNARYQIEKALWKSGKRLGIHYASYYGLSFFVEKEIERKVSVDAKLEGLTPLMWAVQGGQPKVVSLLLEAGADKSIRTAEGKLALGLMKPAMMTPKIEAELRRLLK